MAKKKQLGELLVEDKVITEAQYEEARARQNTTGRKLGEILLEMGYVSEDLLLNYLARQLHVPYIKLNQFQLKPDVINALPEALARRFKAIPLEKLGEGYLVAMVDPSDLIAYDEIARQLKGTIRVALVKESEVVRAIDQFYRRTDEIASLADELADDIDVEYASLEEPLGEQDDADAAPVIKLLSSIFEDANSIGASDVHIEPGRKELRIRMRVDGVLHETVMDKKSIVSALVLRVKLMSKLNISEKRLPQDGRCSIKVRNNDIDVRVSTMPTTHGEAVVMRLLDQSKGLLRLKQLGLHPENLERLNYHIGRPHGMVLVTGPTGSGKSTTLYACLNELNVPERKIITVEDPVEYSLPRICQVQVQSKIGLDFAKVLRSCLRQDPDIVMVGEIRDEETAGIALKAALTGHLVFSTLHTNDAVSAPMRLINMGVPAYLVAGTVRLVVAQRLVRRVCPECRQTYTPEPNEKAWLDNIAKEDTSQYTFYQGRGCSHCNNTGYAGRKAVHELLELDQEMGDALRQGDNERFSTLARHNPSYTPLAACVLRDAIAGETTVEEVLRMATEVSSEE